MSDQGSRWQPTVPGYEIVGELGRGGFATVYEAIQITIDRPVALKVINSAAVGAETNRRFRAECRTIGRLSWHPHIVALHDAGTTAEGAPFLAMELIAAGSLGDKVRTAGPLAPEAVVRYGQQVADALGAAHEAGVVHRDVKPDNVMLGRRGEVLLTDFGIATLADGTASATGSFVGTLAYSAPELLRGQRASPTTDVYSLGTTLYTLVAGSAAFAPSGEVTPAAVMWRVTSEDPPPLPPSVPEPLAQVIGHAMAKDPAARYPVAAAFADALRAAAHEITRPSTRSTVGDHRPPNKPPPGQHDIGNPPGDPRPTIVGSPLPPDQRSHEDPDERPLPPPPPAEPVPEHRVPRWALAAGIVTVLALVTGGLTLASRNNGGDDGAAVTHTIGVGADPMGVTVGAGSVWVANNGDRTVSRIEPGSSDVTETVDVGPAPESVAVDQVVWVADSTEGSVSQINPESGEVGAPIDIGSFGAGVAIGEDSVWAVDPAIGGSVHRIDPDSQQVTDTIDLESPNKVAVGEGSVWVTHSNEDTVSRIDPESNVVTDDIDVGSGPDGVAVGEGSVWVANAFDGTVSRIDPATGEVTDTIEVGRSPQGVALGAGSVWVANSEDGTVSRIDPATGEVTEEVPVGLAPSGVAVGEGSVWVTNTGDGTVSRIAP